MGKGQELYKKAKKIIPGGTQLLSKRPEMFLPDFWPAYYEKAKGCEIWDMDGIKYTDMSYMGIGSAILGYADPDVNKAVKKAIDNGSITTLNSPEEEELAQVLIKIHPWSKMVRFARSGGEAMAIAVRIGRAKTKKDKVLFCGYHGWHDWYLAANLSGDGALDGHLLPGLNPLGVPRALKNTSFPFSYNDTEGFLRLMKKHKGDVGVVVMESIRNTEPEKKFIETIRRETKKEGIVLVVDEITAGFRLNYGGAHLLYSLEPDIAVFGKGMSNGFPMAAIIGTEKVMTVAQDSFISSTYWTERVGPVAALATLKKYQKNNVHKHLVRVGKKIQDAWTEYAKKHGLDIHVEGIYPLGHFSFKGNDQLVLKTLYTQIMLEKGFLASTAFYASFAHKDSDINKYIKAIDKVFEEIAVIIKKGNPEKYLKGPVCHSGFKRLT